MSLERRIREFDLAAIEERIFRFYSQPGTITHWNSKERIMKETVYSITQSDVPATNLKRFDQFEIGDFLSTLNGECIGVKVGTSSIRWAANPAGYGHGLSRYGDNKVCTIVPAHKLYRVPARVDISVTL